MKMSSSFTVTFSGKKSVLQSHFLPEITLDNGHNYSCALLDLIIEMKNKADLEKIVGLGVLHIKCDVISGSYINGVRSHVIHQFASSTSVVKGQIFVEIPKHLNYFPLNIKNLSSIQISIVDNKGREIDIYGGDISCRINIKRECNEKSAKSC